MASIGQQVRLYAHPERTPAGERQLAREHPTGISGSYVATSYGPPWGGEQGTGVTATGTVLSREVRTKTEQYIIAVDPNVIPLGTMVYIWPNPFDYVGQFKADDTGGAIRGRRIDFYDPRGRFMQNSWGRRTVKVEVNPIRKRNFENEDLGEGGPIPFGGLDTGSEIGEALSTLFSRFGSLFSGRFGSLFSGRWWFMVAKIAIGGLILLLALSRISGAI